MTNRVTVTPQGNGTLVWAHRIDETGAELRYVFVPKSQLIPGDRIENMRIFRAGPNGLPTQATENGRGVLSAADIADFPAGSFVRMREVP